MSYYENELVDKAVGLYFRHARRYGLRVDQPNRNMCRQDGNTVYLENIRGVLARYRVRAEGRLRQLRSA